MFGILVLIGLFIWLILMFVTNWGLIIITLTAIILPTIIGFIIKANQNADVRNANNLTKNCSDILKDLNIYTKADFKNFEESAFNKIFSPLEQLNLSIYDLRAVPSSLGIMGYANNCLYTSLELEITGKNFDPLRYYMNLNNTKYNCNFSAVLYKLTGGTDKAILSSITEANIDAFIRHVNILKGFLRDHSEIKNCIPHYDKDIAYYRVIGNTHYISEVSGGGANLSNAFVGGVLAGDAGAIVGSKIGTEIKTNTILKDDRQLYLYSYDGISLSADKIITNNIDAVLEVLRTWIPHKEYDYIVAMGTTPIFNQRDTLQAPHMLPLSNPGCNSTSDNVASSNPTTVNPISELKEYRELLDLGVITRSEYEQKKRKLQN